jgi:amino-acid N-acetyltransferase
MMRGGGREFMDAHCAFRAATAEDAVAIQALLVRCSLPTADLDRSPPEFTVACEADRVIGVGGIERYGATGLLRSVAVTPDRRGWGVGQALVANLERQAINDGLTELVLLTETARRFFEKQGYRAIQRDAAPALVQLGEEFRSLCPQSACCMSKNL